MENANPTVFKPVDIEALKAERDKKRGPNERDPIDELEIYEMIRNINDPEHPLTLEALHVVEPRLIKVVDDVDGEHSAVDILFTPTIPHW